MPTQPEITAAMKALHAERCGNDVFLPFNDLPELTRKGLEHDAIAALQRADNPVYPLS